MKTTHALMHITVKQRTFKLQNVLKSMREGKASGSARETSILFSSQEEINSFEQSSIKLTSQFQRIPFLLILCYIIFM
jgi:hypothetical protein